MAITASVLTLYLSPLLFTNGNFYVPVFDNLDSTVVWYKTLVESGQIFASNDTVIPNIMHGLPRSSYPGEFNILLWLYYFSFIFIYSLYLAIVYVFIFYAWFTKKNSYDIIAMNFIYIVSIIRLPLFYSLSNDDQNKVIQIIYSFFNKGTE